MVKVALFLKQKARNNSNVHTDNKSSLVQLSDKILHSSEKEIYCMH